MLGLPIGTVASRLARAKEGARAESWRNSVSSDLERMLRDAREALPEPGDDATQRVRGRSVSTVRRRRRVPRPRARRRDARRRGRAGRHGRIAQRTDRDGGAGARRHRLRPGARMVRTAVAAARGSRAADRRRRRQRPVRGRRCRPRARRAVRPPVLDAAEPASARHRARRDDDAGNVSAPRADPTNPIYPKVELPLRLRNGVPWVQWGAQVRPDQPLAQYQLRASIRDYNVDVFVYFGTSRPSKASWTRRSASSKGSLSARSSRRALPARAGAVDDTAALAVIDRTYVCNTSILGGIYELKNRAHAGVRSGSGWAKLPWAGASSGGWAGPLTGLPNAPGNTLAWITAGAPSTSTTVGVDGEVFPVLGGGTIGVNSSMCRPSKAKVALSPSGLRGGAATTSWSLSTVRLPVACSCDSEPRWRDPRRCANVHDSSSRRTLRPVRRSSP